jgi:hypothetical protein
VSVRRTAGKDDEMRVRRLGDMRVRRSGGLVLRILIVELKAVAISVPSPVAVATPSRQ